MNTRLFKNHSGKGNAAKILAPAAGLVALAATLLPQVGAAQDNPIPLNYRNLTVTAVEINNNQRRFIGGAKVTIEPRKAKNASRYIKFPQRDTTQANNGQARFSKLPPSREVGPYTILIETRDCGKQKKTLRMGGGSDQRLQVTFNRCGKAKEVTKEHERRKQGGYNLYVELKYDTGRPGGGLWVYLYDPKGKLVKRVRTSSGGGEAKFRAIQPGKNYYIEARYGAKTVLKERFNMPKSNEALKYTVKQPSRR